MRRQDKPVPPRWYLASADQTARTIMITRQDVVSAYRLLLGREPENEEVVQSARLGYQNLEALRRAFFGSREFADGIAPIILKNRFPHDLDEGNHEIEVDCEAPQLSELLARVERTWSRLGDENPHWSVVTDDAFDVENFHANQAQFWASGEVDVLRMRRWMKRNRVALPNDSTCLEFGCGTGRVTRWLANEYRRVIAYDISENHLRLARQAVQPIQDDKVTFVRVSRLSGLDDIAPFDILFSILVLQHNPPPVIAYVLDKLLSCLRPGGIAYFQVPTFRSGYSFSVADYLDPQSGSGQAMEMHVLPQRKIFEIAARHGCQPIEVEPDNLTASLDFISTTFLLRKSTG